MTSRNLFPDHLDWTESTCYYAAATKGHYMALLSGPYRTSAEAQAALGSARRWALRASGDRDAGNYKYLVFTAHTGHSRSILGELPPPLGNLTRFDDYEINPCERTKTPDGRFYYEVCDPDQADIWTLYGHIPGQGVEAIGDFSSFEFAAEVYTRITGRPYA
jgi:hypothetical protein